MRYWLDPCTGECYDIPGDGLTILQDVVEFRCVRCDNHHGLRSRRSRSVFPFDSVAMSVALYYRSHWRDCQLPTYAPTSRDWGQLWRSMLGWLYSNNAGREGVVKTWEVFRKRRLEWLEHMRSFKEVCRVSEEPRTQLFDRLVTVASESWEFGASVPSGAYDMTRGVLVIQREQIPVDNTWVIDERKFDNTFVRVEGTLHDEEVPLYLVAHIPQDAVTPNMVWVVGRDRHTRTLFALRVPAQFRYLDAALRWTMRAEPWDKVEEI